MVDKKKGPASKTTGAGKATKKAPETKLSRLEAMLRRPEGATVAQLVSALGWQAHTIRAVVSVGLRKSKGLTVTLVKGESGERVYRISD